jgi:hypothetical protein
MSDNFLEILVESEKVLRASFIDFGRDPLGQYTPQQVARGAGYLVLTHSLIGQYFEDVCREIVLVSKRKFMTESRVSYVLAFILNNADASKSLPQQKPSKDTLTSRIVEAFVKHEGVISRNDGVKEANLCNLYFPIGFNFDGIDPLFLAEANSFGANRGALAHKSIRAQKFDPIDGVKAISDGYDPTIGIMHEGRDGSSKFAFDLMEPERPRADRAVLDFVKGHVFDPADFVIRTDGVCRLNPEMARMVVARVST